MHQTIYIDVDEEITSILDRIRQEQVMEIFLVIPKGAMLINSIINLKLLKKESERMGKKVTIVAPNDKQSQNIIERAGIRVEKYTEQTNSPVNSGLNVENIVSDGKIQQASAEAMDEIREQAEADDILGSNSFFGRSRKSVNVEMQNNDRQSQPKGGSQGNNFMTQKVTSSDNSIDQSLESKEENYFQHPHSHKKKKKEKPQKTFGKKIFFALVVLLLLALVGGIGWYVVNFPKLELVIFPLREDVSQEVKFTAKADINEIDFENKIIPGEYLEMTLNKEAEFEATGNKIVDKNASVAKGRVVIYNYFSEKPQPLVKTTRILSKKDSKLFRLSRGVTVPGMKGDEPGKIEVEVYADKPGKDFNIEPDDFVIFVWKDTPKGEKFKIKSETAMTGGSVSANATERKVITKSDLDTARKKTISALDESIAEEVKKRLNDQQEVVIDAIDKEVISSKASQQEGAVADSFKYSVEYKVKLIAFNKNDAEELIKKVLQDEIKEGYQLDDDLKIDFKRGISDLEKKSLTVYADTTGVAWFKIDKDKIKQAIKGMDGETTRQALNKEAGVDSAEIRPIPTWVNKSPKDPDKIEIKVVKKIK